MTITRRKTLLAGLVVSGLTFAPIAAQAQDVVKIGFSGPLSGGAAFYGKNVLDGMKMAADEINAKGFEVAGKQVKFEIVSLDDKYNPSETAINAQRLVQQDKIVALLVPHSGGIFAAQTRNQQQKLLVFAYSSLPEITARGNKLTVQLPPNITEYLKPFIGYSMGKFGKNVALAVTDSDYGKVWEKTFKPAWEQAGGKIVADNPLSYNKSADFYSGVSKVLAAKPDVMLIGGPSEPTGLVIKQARELGFKGGFLLIDQAKADEAATVAGGLAALNGTMGVLPTMEDKSPATVEFVKRAQKIYPDRIIGSEFAIPYIGVYMLTEAMKLAGSTSDTEAIRAKADEAYKALPESINFLLYKGVTENGLSVFDGRVAVVEDGKIREVKIADF